MLSFGFMDASAQTASEVPELAWIAALVAEGKFRAAAEAAGRAFAGATLSQRLALIGEWEDLAFAMRPAGVPMPHPSVAGVVPALRQLLAERELSLAQRAILTAKLARQLSWPDPTRPIPEAREAVAMARESGDPTALIHCLIGLHITLDSPAQLEERLALSEEAMRLALHHQSAKLRAFAAWRRMIDCLIAADSAGYDHHLELLRESAQESQDRYWLTIAAQCSATQEVLHGNYARAEEALPALVEAAKWPSGSMGTAVSSIGLLARFQRGQGSVDGLSRMLSGVRAAHVAFRIGLAYYLATSGRATEAAAEFGQVDPADLPDDGGRVPCLSMAIELAALHFRDSVLAERAYAALLPFAGQLAVTSEALNCLGPVDLYLGIAADFLGYESAGRHLDSSLAISASLRARPWLARTLLLQGQAELRTGNEAGRRKLEEALAIAERIEFPAIASAAKTALRGEARRPAPLENARLTGREREVLSLVANGLTAAEAAEKLFLSPRTVEKHLEHAYAKIGARNRAEGIRWAIVNGLTEDP